jgi:uncharacterized protein YuzE
MRPAGAWGWRHDYRLSSAPIEESDEDKPGVIIDYDKDGNVVGLEILDASQRMENLQAVEYAVVGRAA